jgi:hypothetical protein
VAAAIVATQAAVLVTQPVGVVAGLPLGLRLGAVAAGFLVFHFNGRNVLLGVLTGEAVVLAALAWRGA